MGGFNPFTTRSGSISDIFLKKLEIWFIILLNVITTI